MRRPVIYGYTDYRMFLRDYFEYRKMKGNYSYRTFAKDAGITSPNYLKLVLDRQKNLKTQAMIHKFITGLKLTDRQAQYFNVLVKLDLCSDSRAQERLKTQLLTLMPQSRKRMLEGDDVAFCASWLHSVLRSLAYSSDFDPEPYALSQKILGQPNYNEIAQSLTFLFHQGFLQRSSSGVKVRDSGLTTKQDLKNAVIRQFHKQMLVRSAAMLDLLPPEEREFGALTILASESAVGELKAMLRSFAAEVTEWIKKQRMEKKGDKVVLQLNFQLYPQTRSKSSSQNEKQ